jgi:hypothetical protein
MSSEDYELVKKGQVLADTNEDAHGEQYDEEFLRTLLEGTPEEFPLQQHHDDTLEHVGVIKNQSIEEIEEDTLAIVGDVYTKDGQLPQDIGGFSWAAKGGEVGPEGAEIKIYLPFPSYRDEKLNETLLAYDRVAVGKYIKKSKDTFLMALIQFGERVVAGTLSALLAQAIYSKVSAHWEVLKELWNRQIGTQFQIPIEWQGYEFPLIMVPSHDDYARSLSEEELEKLGTLVEFRLRELDLSNVGQIHKARATYNPESSDYQLVDIQVETGDGKFHVFE